MSKIKMKKVKVNLKSKMTEVKMKMDHDDVRLEKASEQQLNRLF